MQIILPKLGLTMTHGTITEWLKAPGDEVRAEEALCTYETEKVTLELTAPEDGVLVQILVPAGTTVPAGTAVCEFQGRSELRRVRSQVQDTATSPQSSAPGPQPPQPPTPGLRSPAPTLLATPKARHLARQFGIELAQVAGSGPNGRIQAADVTSRPVAPLPAGEEKGGTRGEVKATPLARRIAASEGIDLNRLTGTGPDGLVTREDVEQAIRHRDAAARAPAPGPQPPATGTLIPHSTLRRTIAQRMSQSAFSAPHVTLMTEAEATNLVSARVQLNEELALKASGAAGTRISYNALLVALVARALREHPHLNARWEAEGIRLLVEINIALAVDTERGLVTPVLRGVDRLNLPQIQAGYDALIARAVAGRSLPDDFADGTFTITNLGALDVDGFTPIINPPQAAILGVGRILEKPVARDGAVVVRPMLTLSLSFDHRIVDGAPAARFLQRVKQLVERPMALLMREA